MLKSFLTTRLFLLLLFAVAYCFTFIVEIIPVYGSVGYDGLKYHRIAHEGLEMLKSKNITGYHVFRYVPFVFYDVLNLSPETKSILLFFKIFNLLSIGMAVFYFFKIANLLKWKEQTANLGFILLFFSFPILKLVNFYPLLTDHFSFALSITGVYFYFKRNRFVIILILLLSLFNLPTLTFALLLLIITDERNKIKVTTISKKVFTFLIKVAAISILALPIYFYYLIQRDNPEPLYSGVELNISLLIYSGIALFLYFVLVVWAILKASKDSQGVSIHINILYFSLAILMGVLMYWIFGNYPAMPKTGMSSFTGMAYRALTMPLNFYIYHVFYFGLLMTFSLLFIKSIFKESLQLGLGWFIVVILFYLLSIQNESRILINLIVFIVVPLLQSINQQKSISKLWLFIVIGVSIILSRFYIKLNYTSEMWKLMEDPNEFLKFPVQRYFMNFGPWVNYDMYYFQSVIFLVTLIIGIFLIINLNAKETYNAKIE